MKRRTVNAKNAKGSNPSPAAAGEAALRGGFLLERSYGAVLALRESRDLHVEYLEVPPEVERAVRPEILRLLWAAPLWCARLTVRFDERPSDGDVLLNVSTSPEYRCATIRICPGWLALMPDRRRQTLTHEFAHMAVAPISEFARGAFKRHITGGLLEELDAQLIERVEAATEDLTNLIHRIAKEVDRCPA